MTVRVTILVLALFAGFYSGVTTDDATRDAGVRKPAAAALLVALGLAIFG